MATKREEELERELERVRGLLQRHEWRSLDKYCPECHRHQTQGHSADCVMAAALSGITPNEALPAVPSCSIVGKTWHSELYENASAPSGAESADIGKLDTTDEAGGTDASSR